ncbi:MAG: hypothetical protein K2O91_21515, partial [Lachnospiraceae bacterium]|nr:hypothetical protein [Lachnospiraceae bacterium]
AFLVHYTFYIDNSLPRFNPNDNSFFQKCIGNSWQTFQERAILLKKSTKMHLKILWSILWSKSHI